MNPSKLVGWLLVGTSLLLCGLVEQRLSDDPQRLSPRRACYPRVLRLQHQPTRNGRLLASFDTDGNRGMLYESTDDGRLRQALTDLIRRNYYRLPMNGGCFRWRSGTMVMYALRIIIPYLYPQHKPCLSTI